MSEPILAPIIKADEPCFSLDSRIPQPEETQPLLKHKNISKTCINPETCTDNIEIKSIKKSIEEKTDEEKIQDLLNWKKWELSEKVEIRRGNYGLGVFAKEDLEKGETLFFAPPEQTIMITMAIEALESVITDVDDVNEPLDCADTLSLFILFELRKGDESELWPYLATMQKEYTTPLDYWPMELHDFLTPAAFDFLYLATADYVDSYKKLQKILEKYNVEEEEFHRAYSIVTTRYYYNDAPENHPDWFISGLGEGDCGALGPIFDLWNHEVKPNCDWEVGEGGAMKMTTDESIAAGQELFISYGVDENVRMAQTYGFTFSDVSKVEENIYLYKDEIVDACVARLGKAREECEEIASNALKQTGDEGGHIDFNCGIESFVLETVFDHDNPEDDDENAKTARLYRGALFLIYRRREHLGNLLEEIEGANWDEQFLYHKEMATNIARAEQVVVEKCMKQMENFALGFERNA
ncbi:Oidioi.mRNA.OKI2018_I69.PAR.g8665.t1.cds [Oikopleura dioica]|uniref:Oidioi.mRNA.OKI2018_I69.PAR.g8665.t1.cds n=1 Tax=Oikopleura dioica TaxID=34765 RepID=A0ABN7RH20_OIKDI|nr:Oidioi.mRNA.OKI2018_I69.PAR.g8665.t1.cds [Oikopleura dioica]